MPRFAQPQHALAVGPVERVFADERGQPADDEQADDRDRHVPQCETALAADSMSSTIASIRNDSGMVASEISVLSQEFGKMGGRLQQLEQAASEFSRRVA